MDYQTFCRAGGLDPSAATSKAAFESYKKSKVPDIELKDAQKKGDDLKPLF